MLRASFIYRDEIEEIVRTPFQMMLDYMRNRLEGDCDDISTFQAAILSVWGYPVRLVAIRYEESTDQFQHVFIETEQRGRWTRYDITTPPGTLHRELDRMVMDV